MSHFVFRAAIVANCLAVSGYKMVSNFSGGEVL